MIYIHCHPWQGAEVQLLSYAIPVRGKCLGLLLQAAAAMVVQNAAEGILQLAGALA